MAIERPPWEDFRDAKLLWFVNRLLHLFGWAICFAIDDEGTIKEVYPARVTFRGFDPPGETEGFYGLTQYLHDNSERLLQDFDTKEVA